MEQITSWDICFNFIVWLGLLFYYRGQIKRNTERHGTFWGFCIVIILFSTFSFCAGDFLHYESLYVDLRHSNYNIHIEPFYYWLIKVLPESYYVWRCAVWGVAAIILVLIFKRLKLKGLKEDTCYKVSGYAYDCYGDELMQVGMILSDSASGVWKKGVNDKGDFQAEVFEIVAV